MQSMILLGALASTYLMLMSKRMPALVRAFRCQSFFLFMTTLILAHNDHQADLYVIAGLLLAIKVFAIPHMLYRIIGKVKANEDIGLFINVQLSLVLAVALMGLSWAFVTRTIFHAGGIQVIMPAAAIFMFLAGIFLMIFRQSALAQVVGLLATENGLFLLASTIAGGMPFLVEMAIFFDVFVSVIIMGFFVYRIKRLFTHIDVKALSRLRG
jgi:hydrogenase-4 component E